MSAKLRRLAPVSSILVTTLLLISSIAGMQVVGAAAAATPTRPTVLTQASPLATTSVASASSVNANPLDWTEDTGPGATGMQGWNFSPQTQINLSSVSSLQTSYIFPVPS